MIGRSEIVGKPMAMLLLQRDATVTICHSQDAGPAGGRGARPTSWSRRSAARRSSRRDFVKPGATVIDVGHDAGERSRRWSRRSSAPARRGCESLAKRGSVVVGDVHPAVAEVAGALTPVPGGVGPLTIAMLLKNTLAAAEARPRRAAAAARRKLRLGT